MNNEKTETRQERRGKKLQKKRERVVQHGKGLGRLYKEAILKRIRGRHGKKKKRKGV